MRGKTIAGTFVVLLALSAFAVYLWMINAHKPAFRLPLFRFDYYSITSISVAHPEEELIFSRPEQGLHVSDGQRGGFFLSENEIYTALRDLLTLYPEGMAPGQYSLPSTSSSQVSVRLRFNKHKEEAFKIIMPIDPGDSALLQFSGEKEVFYVPRSKVAFFFRPFSDFNNRTFARLPRIGQVDSLSYFLPLDSLRFIFCRDSSSWKLNNAAPMALDSAIFIQWWQQINRISAPLPSLDFDEVQEAGNLNRQLVFWSKGRPVLEIDGFLRSGGPAPFIVQSSQRPGDYFAGDSTGLFRYIFAPLDSLILPNLNK